MSLGERLSAGAAGAVAAFEPIVRFVRPDVGRLIAEHRAGERDLVAWGEARPAGPVIWLHGASAGELLGAVPAIEELRSRADFSLVVTHFSPSGVSALERLEPDVSAFSPLDRRAGCRRVAQAVRPDLLVFAKLDIWPVLVAEASHAGIPVALVNGVVRAGSSRLRWPGRSLLLETYATLSAVGAASEEDAARLRRLGVRSDVLRITGDASFDLARARADDARQPGGAREVFEAALPRRPDVGRRLVAGSTWEADEGALLDAIEALPATSGGRFGWQLVLAPHKPSEPHVRRLCGECRRRGHPVARWSDRAALAELPSHGVVVFDEMGSLAELYTAGDIGYVGGGFGSAGLHNVLEPAAAGVPLLFGPRHDRRDATGLLEVGAAFECEERGLRACLEHLSDEEERRRAGKAARDYVVGGSGAAAGTADMLAALLQASASPDV